MTTTFIYALKDPGTGACRYIGKADSPHRRLHSHLSGSRTGGTHKKHWLMGLAALGLVPEMEILDEVPRERWRFFERAYVKAYREAGFSLTNTTDGGDGSLGMKHTAETRAKMSIAWKGKPRPWNRGRKASPETRAKMSESRRGENCSAETRRKLSLAGRGRERPIAWRRHVAKTKRGRKMSFNTSGFVGVYLRKLDGKWFSMVQSPEGKPVYLGAFTDKSDAVFVRALAMHNYYAV